PKQRLYHLVIAIIFIIPLSILNLYHFSAPPLSDQILLIIPIVSSISLLLILLLYLKNTFLGAERKSVQIVHTGTGLVHHSLKNDTGKIKLNALNLRKSIQAERYEETEKYIDNLLNTYDAMLNTLSTISQATNATVRIKKEYDDLAKILDEVLAATEIPTAIHVQKQYASTYLYIDPHHITECLQNIINNALDAMNDGGELNIQIHQKKKISKLVITDTGCGMTGLQLQNIFEPFYSTKRQTGKHYGLGLYQAKKVMLAHKGKIEVSSAPAKGTTIILTFRK
ncbi:ATP-binding protein, partial [Providencia sp. NPDC089923]|uniref:ATP-binding protein n=1 Tax=Providencia sp. NPDC089923 TaxID=3415004 RepID=UPI003C2AD0DB